MNYYCYKFETEEENREVLIALLSECVAFDTYQETDEGVEAYLPEKDFNEEIAKEIRGLRKMISFIYRKKFIPYRNWNKEWESNFEPIRIDDFVGIRADFHAPTEGVEFDLVINPKMAFGTGHHETTYMVMDFMRRIDFKNKYVFDFGGGTGILAILALKLNAQQVDAVDNELPSYENTIENAALNEVHNIKSIHGTLDDVSGTDFDIILANINRNVILASLDTLYGKLKRNGTMLISGIMLQDEEMVKSACISKGFNWLEVKHRGNWMAAKLVK
jgi:ribosomal protein L11 methyltransferase